MKSSTIRGIRSSLILLLDLIAIVGLFSGTYLLRLAEFPNYRSPDLWLITATFLIILFLSGTYFKERSAKLPSLPIRTFLVCLVAGTVCVLWVYLLGPSEFNEYFGRGILPAATVLCGIATTLIRYLINRLYHRQELGTELLYLGYSESGKAFLQELDNHLEVRQITIASSKPVEARSDRHNVTTEEVSALLGKRHWQSVIVDPNHQAGIKETDELVSLRLAGIPVLSLADFYEKYWYMIPVHVISDDWFLRSQGFSMLDNPMSLRVKRVTDIVLATITLIISAPLVLLCAVLIKLTSSGPVLFKQKRVGLRGEVFTIYKLRTMANDAEANGAQWAQAEDPRVTKFGKFLRQTRIDEIPQCWNVIQGTMSFVGPRPERPEFTKHLAQKIPYFDLRHLVPPGITGWAQVIFPYGASEQDALKKLQYELYYIKNRSLMLDVNIMLRTFITVFQRAGR